MIVKTIRVLLTAILVASLLFLVSAGISYFIAGSTKPLDLMLFVLGAIPIVSFSPGLFNKSNGRVLHTPKLIWRLVGSPNQNENGTHSGTLFTPWVIYRKVKSSDRKKSEPPGDVDKNSNPAASFSLVLSGVILWIVSYFV